MWLLLASVAAREVLHRLLGGRRFRGVRQGGVVSAVIWNTLWVAVFAFAVLSAGDGTASPTAWIGFPVLWIGTALRCWALRTLGGNYAVAIRTGPAHRLVTGGPYRGLRHPLHLGLVLEMAGLGLIACRPILAVPVAIGFLVLLARNAAEDRVLQERFGEEFRAYRERAWDPVDLLRVGGAV